MPPLRRLPVSTVAPPLALRLNMPSHALPPSAPPPGARDQTPPDLEPVLLASRYQLDRRIGQGGMSEVWLATDLQLDRRVAVKWLRPSLAADAVVAERFRREAVAVARLNHPNIVAVHDVFEHEGRQAVVMQLVDGRSLRQLLDTQRRLGPELTIHVGAAVASALDEAHRAGFVHRDVKPGNIMLTSDGRVLLTDFGIAKGLDGSTDDLTSDNVMMGTAKYLSPEQVRGKKLDGRADLYSLGLVLYECLAGRVPFQGESDADTALARLQRDPTDLGRLRPTLPPGLVDLIHQTLSRNPEHRPASGADLRSKLLAVDTALPRIDNTPSKPTRRLLGGARAQSMTSAGPATPSTSSGEAAQHAIPGEPTIGSDAEMRSRVRDAVSDVDRDTGRDSGRTSGPTDDHTPPRGGGSGDTETVVAHRSTSASPADDHDVYLDDRAGYDDSDDYEPAAAPLHRSGRGSLVVIAALLATAAVVVALIWSGLSGDNAGDTTPDGDTGAETVEGAQTPEENIEPELTLPELGSGSAEIATVTAWDPFGDGSGENDNLASLALVGANPAGGWPTLCYGSQYFGAKDGVGLVATLSGPASGRIGLESFTAPFWIEFYASADEDVPQSLAAWGESISGTVYREDPAVVESSVPGGTRHVLVWLREVGVDDACSGTNPYRGRLGNLQFTT